MSFLTRNTCLVNQCVYGSLQCCCYITLYLLPVQEKNANLQGQLAEIYRVEETSKTELEAARTLRLAAEKEKTKAETEMKSEEKKRLEAYTEIEYLRKEVEETKRQLTELEVCEGIDTHAIPYALLVVYC